MRSAHIFKYAVGLLVTLIFCSVAQAKSSDPAMEGVAGQVGKLYVHGSLIENACRIEMASLYQTIDLGSVGTAQLKQVGDQADSTTFQIRLLDCPSHGSEMVDFTTGLKTWSSNQPSLKLRFLAKSDPFNPDIVQVNGAKGLGLIVTDITGNIVHMGQFSRPILLDQPLSLLRYKVTPIKTGELEPNAFDALIFFELIYE